MNTIDSENIADSILDVYQKMGSANYSGEQITQLEHACQAGALAGLDKQDDDVILAAFLHDFGHLLVSDTTENMDAYGVKDHEKIGADKLAEYGFSEKVTTLVQSHVLAKRYLCFANERYYTQLSLASRMTLAFQGGPMSKVEAEAFELHPLKHLIIKMRTWDERAKEEKVPLPNLEEYRQRIIRHLSR